MAEKNLKHGWRKVKFGDVVRQCKEKADPETSGLERYVAGEHMDTDDLRIRRWGEIGSGYLGPAFHMRFRPGQVLYGSRRTYLRKVAVADFDGICANTTFVLETKNAEELLPEYLPFLMQTDAFNEFSVKNSKGSVNPYINFSDLAQFEFALPSLSEQKVAIASFEAIAEMKDALLSLRDSAWKLLESHLNAVFQLGENPFNEPENENYPCKRLADLIKVRHGWPFKSECFNTDKESGPLLLTPSNFAEFGEFKFAPERNKYYSSDFPEEYRLKEGALAVLMTDLTPTARLLGAPGMVPANMEVLQNQRIGLVIPSSESIMVRYLFYFFLSDSFRRLVRAQSAGSTVSHTSPTQICRIPIPLPSLDRQESLVEVFDQIFSSFWSAESRLHEVISLGAISRETILGKDDVH